MRPVIEHPTAGTQLLLGRDEFTAVPAALEGEWLLTNGLGGYACGSVSGIRTRRYHGLLIAALKPPVQRTLLLGKVLATLTWRDRHYELDSSEFADGTIAPGGFRLLREFRLEDGLPVWRFSCADLVVTQRIWMPHGSNTTCIEFAVSRAREPVLLELTPLCACRDYHAHGHGGSNPQVESAPMGCRVVAFPGAPGCTLKVQGADFAPHATWYWRFRHRVEAERGLDSEEDLFSPGSFRIRLGNGATATLVASAEADAAIGATHWRTDQARRAALLESAPAGAPPWIRQLVQAADDFLVLRRDAAGSGTTLIAGYPWFSDWGRDTMIALPGLTLATGRPEQAASILRTYAQHVDRGMLPNRFPDQGEAPEYNTVDATLWYFHALACYLDATGDTQLLKELFPTLEDIIAWHQRGTRFGIGVDPVDGLLRAGEPGVQLTWMDAKIGDWVVTPRTGKPVEINALWHFALAQMSRWAVQLGQRDAGARYGESARRTRDAFAAAFWNEDGACLYDVIDGPDGGVDASGRRVDRSIRPNQLFAITLAPDLLSRAQSGAVLECCARELLTPVGLRSLAASDPRYAARYEGGPRERDAAYHQGTVWSWLLGPFALAHYRVHGDAGEALACLEAIAPHLHQACLGQVSEIFDGEAPHRARGCFAQAWSVAEILRAWHEVSRSTALTIPESLSPRRHDPAGA